MHDTKTIKVGNLARVEGEGALYVKIQDKKVVDVELKIFEPPRFFEALLRGRSFDEAPDITSRICGICPVAYQMSSIQAMEDAFGILIPAQLRELRRLFYCGEWISSHTLHVYMLHAPDFLGYADALGMAKDHPKIVERGLELKKIGNEILALLGGREIHPVSARVGGFYRVPTRQELLPLAERLKLAREIALATVRWVATFSFPAFEHDYTFVSLRHPREYPINEGRIVSNTGLDIAVHEYEEYFTELHVSHSNALQSVMQGQGAYFVGPMARYNLNFDRLPPLVQEAAREAGLAPTCRNPFQSIIIRSLEILYACDEAIRIIENYEMPEQPSVPVEPHAATGYGATEAPRGILYHRYRLANSGLIEDATIIPPTSQNQKIIEKDLWHFVSQYINLPSAELKLRCEQTIRNYDPCISCATHFLDLHVEKE